MIKNFKSRAYIGQFVEYNSTNILRIWIPSRKKLIGIWDVKFDEKDFYNPQDVDLGVVMPGEDFMNLLEVLEFNKCDPETENTYESVINLLY